jgi:hypothetical protein
MKEEEVKQLVNGIYRIYWKSGGSSLASVGVTFNGGRWLAPINWVSPTEKQEVWESVKKVTLKLTKEDR